MASTYTRTAAIALIAFAAALAASGQTDRGAPGTIGTAAVLPLSIPYTYQDGLIVVKATIGTGLSQDAVIATALPLTLITPDLATKQGIQGQGVLELTTLGGPARVQGGAPQTITIGRAPLNTVPVGIFDLYTHLSSRPLPGAPSIWLGWSSLGALCFTIDPEKREVILQPSGLPPARNATVIPFTLQDGRMYVQAKLNGHRPVRMLVDTASVGTLIPADAARALRLPEVGTLTAKSASGKESRVTAVTLSELFIAGTVRMKDLRALYVAAGDAPDLGMDTGILGTDALLKYRVTINYARNTITFDKIEPKKDVVQSAPTGPVSPPAAAPQEVKAPQPAPVSP